MTTLSEAELTVEANKDPTISPYYVTILYGDYGSRKTSTACSMSKDKCLLLSSDDSWKVLLNPRHSEVYARTTIKQLEGLSQLKYIDLEGYDTIVWDTVSQSVDVFLDLVYDEADWAGKYRDKLKTNNPQLKEMNIETLAPVDYRIIRDTTRPIFNRLFRETKSHIILTSQMTEPMPGLSANQQKRPSIPASTFKTLGTRADIIANTRGLGNKFVADVTQSLTQLGKSRIEGIQGQMDTDTFISKYKEIVF